LSPSYRKAKEEMRVVLNHRVLGATVVMLLIAAPAAPAAASGGSAVSMTLPSDQATAEMPFAFSYASRRLPTGTTVYLQKQVGTAHVWQDVSRLRGTAGAATAPGRPLGVYKYRLTAVRRHKTVAVSAVQVVYSYGTVTIPTLCRALGDPCSGGTEAIGDTVFEYDEGPNAPGFTYPEFGESFKANHTTCRSGQVSFAFFSVPKTGRAYMRLLQASAEPQEASTTDPTEIGIFNMTFDGGPWDLENASSNGSNLVISATFSCYTATGQ
jgi:hypothetical protein